MPPKPTEKANSYRERNCLYGKQQRLNRELAAVLERFALGAKTPEERQTMEGDEQMYAIALGKVAKRLAELNRKL